MKIKNVTGILTVAAPWLTFITTMLLVLSGCSGGGQQSKKQVNGEASVSKEEEALTQPIDPVLVGNPSTWPTQEVRSGDGSLTYRRAEMTRAEREYWQKEIARRTSQLSPIPIDPSYNVMLFRINKEEWRNVAFVAPRVYAYSSADGGSLATFRRTDGTVDMPFPAILIDGTSETIKAADDRTIVKVPRYSLIQNLAGLREDLRARGIDTLATLHGCPKKVSVLNRGESYDATNPDLLRADYCELNRPFTVALRIPEDDARNLLEESLYANAVGLSAAYQVMVPFVVANATIEMDKESLFRQIEAKLSAKIYWAQVDVQVAIRNIMEREVMKVSIEGERNQYIDKLIDGAIDRFFKTATPPPGKQLPECEKSVCLQLNYNYAREEHKLLVTWNESSTTLSGQVILTSTMLQPIQDFSIKLGDVDDSTDCGKAEGALCKPGLKNDGKAIELGLTVNEGTLIEVTPNYVRKEIRQYNVPQVRHVEDMFCHQWGCFQRSNPNPATGCDMNVGRNPPHLQWRCVAPEDRGYDITTYSMGEPRFEKQIDPIARESQLFEGLYIRFTWFNNGPKGDGKKNEIECPINVFSRNANGKSMLVRLENQPGCQPFNSGNSPMLHLINKIKYPETYLVGRKVKHWNGSVTESPSESTYLPEVEFGGTISVRGHKFGSSPESSARIVR